MTSSSPPSIYRYIGACTECMHPPPSIYRWEQQLHDILEPAFGDLQSIFIHYCGSSIQGTESIGNATKLGLMEVLTLAKDTKLPTKLFTPLPPHSQVLTLAKDTKLPTKLFSEDELTRHFVAANHQQMIATSGSAERHAAVAGVQKKKKLPWDPIREAIERCLKSETPPSSSRLHADEPRPSQS